MDMKRICCAVSMLVMTFATVACDNQGKEGNGQPAPQATEQTSEGTAGRMEVVSLEGKVLETMTSGGFTYIHLDGGAAKTWIAVPQTEVAVGENIRLKDGRTFADFYSKTLDRKFPALVFFSNIEGKQAVAEPHATAKVPEKPGAETGAGSFAEALQKERSRTGQPPADPAAVSTGSTKAVVPFAELKIKKAAGKNGHSVGELFEKAAALDGKNVVVRAKVMKVSMNIMGKNWLHLQDGTGNPMKNTHDLVATTAAAPEKDAVISIEGVLRANRDFGAGYNYAVIIEDAVVKP